MLDSLIYIGSWLDYIQISSQKLFWIDPGPIPHDQLFRQVAFIAGSLFGVLHKLGNSLPGPSKHRKHQATRNISVKCQEVKRYLTCWSVSCWSECEEPPLMKVSSLSSLEGISPTDAPPIPPQAAKTWSAQPLWEALLPDIC